MNKLVSINNISAVIANLRQGDCLFLDIDATLLLCGIDKYQHPPEITETNLAAIIKNAQESGIVIHGLSTRDPGFDAASIQQLDQVGIHLSRIIHTSSNKAGSEKTTALQDYLADPSNPKPKRILVIDDSKQQLDTINKTINSSETDLILYHYVRPEYQHATKQVNFPETLEGFTQLRSLGGGSESTYQITNPTNDQHFVLKLGAHANALKTEILSNALYHTLGVPVPKNQIYNTLPITLANTLKLPSAHGIFQISEYLVAPIPPLPENELIKQARANFIVHALLGNIDVAKPDNFIGNYLIDAGASFLYRSLGEHRQENSSEVTEMTTLRDPNINPLASHWFGDLNDDEIQSQIIAILEKQDELEKTLWNISAELHFPSRLRMTFLQNFSDRLDFLVTRYCPNARLGARSDRKPNPEQTAAGVLSFTLIDDKPHVLLAKRVGHDWWDNFGGKSDATDHWLYETACREVAEESNGKLNYTYDELLNSPFHDLITQKNGKHFLYRMYLAHHAYVAPREFNDPEHTDYEWVPVEAIVDALHSTDAPIIMEGKQTIAITMQDKKIVLLPEFYNMFQQHSVLEHIKRLKDQKPLTPSHTQGSPTVGPRLPQATHRTMQSPQARREQIDSTLIKHTNVIKQLKNTHKKRPQTSVTSPPPSSTSASEMHLKVILGPHQYTDDLRTNVGHALRNKVPLMQNEPSFTLVEQAKVPPQPSSEQYIALTETFTQLITTEQQNPDRFYFYHACDEKIAFAYQAYTLIYQALQLNEEWVALRGLNKSLNKFDNIEQFIAFYSKNGTIEINNYVEGFGENAISANPFLFGNHASATSNSISYFIDNSTRTAIDLNALLHNVLLSFAIPTQEINRLFLLYSQHLKESGGVLYQISMPCDEARLMSYAAGGVGVLSPYEGSTDLVQVLDLLKIKAKKGELSTEDQAYIIHLQARVLVPPNQPLKMEVIRYPKLNESVEQQLMHELQIATQGIARSVLAHSGGNNANFLHPNTPLLRIQKSIYKVNSLEPEENLFSPIALSDAIMKNDKDAARTIFTKHPEYKMISIPYLPNYQTQIYGTSVNNKPYITPLSMMINYSNFPQEFFAECFGSDWMTQLPLDSLMQLTTLLAKFPEENRGSVFYQLNFPSMQLEPNDELVNLLNTFPLSQRHEWLTILLKANWIASNITSSHSFIHFLEKSPPDDRLNYLMLFDIASIKNTFKTEKKCFISLIKLFQPIQVMSLIQSLGIDSIKDLKTNNEFSELIMLIPTLELFKFIQSLDSEVRRKIVGDTQRLFKVIQNLPESDRVSFIQLMRSDHPNLTSFNDTYLVDGAIELLELAEDKLSPFALSQAIIRNDEQSVRIILQQHPEYKTTDIPYVSSYSMESTSMSIKIAPQIDLMYFMLNYSTLTGEFLHECFGPSLFTQLSFEKDSFQLNKLLNKFPEEKRLGILNQLNVTLIQFEPNDKLANLLKIFPPEHRLACLKRLTIQWGKDTTLGIYDLKTVLEIIPASEAMAFIKFIGITAIKELAKTFWILDEFFAISVEPSFLQEFLQELDTNWIASKIAEPRQFLYFLNKFPQQERIKYFLLFDIEQIKNIFSMENAEFTSLIATFPSNERLNVIPLFGIAFIKELMTKDTFLEIAESIPSSSLLDFIKLVRKAHPNVDSFITTCSMDNVIELLTMLSDTERQLFISGEQEASKLSLGRLGFFQSISPTQKKSPLLQELITIMQEKKLLPLQQADAESDTHKASNSGPII